MRSRLKQDYKVLNGESIEKFEEKVNKYIKAGYNPVGGVSFHNDCLYQAVYIDQIQAFR